VENLYQLSTSNFYEPDLDKVLGKVDRFLGDEGLIVGSAVEEMEKEFAKYHEARFCVAYSTGFWALVSAIANRALQNRDEVLLPSLTYRRLADAVYWTGKTPVFVDIDLNLALSPGSVEENISDKTALILAVHPIVNCCDVEALLDISKRSGVPVIFDAVESVHETVVGKRVGSFGVGEVFSLHASKLLNGLEGGYICTDDEAYASRLREWRMGGGTGLNAVMNDIHAIFALASLEEVESNVKHNKDIYRHYQETLSKISHVRLLEFDEREQTSYKHIVVEVLDGFPVSRDELVELFNQQGILARAHYWPPLHEKQYRYPVRTTSMEVTDWASGRFLNLPCGYRVTVRDVDYVCDVLSRPGRG